MYILFYFNAQVCNTSLFILHFYFEDDVEARPVSGNSTCILPYHIILTIDYDDNIIYILNYSSI